jgi:hypothetical protein
MFEEPKINAVQMMYGIYLVTWRDIAVAATLKIRDSAAFNL